MVNLREILKNKIKSSFYKEINTFPFWFSPLVFLVLFVSICGSVYWMIHRNEQRLREGELKGDTESVGESMRQRLNGNQDYLLMLALERADGSLNINKFQEIASVYVANHPELINITWVDAYDYIIDAAPRKNNRQILGLRLNLPEPKRASGLARQQKHPVYTHSFEAIQGSVSFEIWVPVYKGAEFLGYFAGVYSCGALLSQLVSHEMQSENFVSIVDSSGAIIASLPEKGDVNDAVFFRYSLLPQSRTFFLQFNSYQNSFSWGLILSIVLSFALVLGMTFSIWILKREVVTRKNIEDALRISEEKFREIFNATHEAIIMHDPETFKILDVNASMIAMYGFDSKEEVLNGTIGNLSEDISPYTQNEAELNIHKAMQDGPQVFEWRARKKNGEEFWVEVSLRSSVISRQARILAVVRDIDERKQAEFQLKNYTDELKAMNESKNKLFSIISHDLRGPFQGILGVSDALTWDSETLTSSEVKEYNLALNKALKKQFDLLNDLLDWSRIQLNSFSLKLEDFLIHEHVDIVVDRLKVNAAQKQIAIINNVGKNYIVKADMKMLELVLRNLISNALKFTNPRGTVEITALNKGEFVEISVCDNGVGISEDAIKKLFRIDVSYSTSGTNDEKGTGLGLILCKEIVEKHGGKIGLESTKGQGSRFFITLPAQ